MQPRSVSRRLASRTIGEASSARPSWMRRQAPASRRASGAFRRRSPGKEDVGVLRQLLVGEPKEVPRRGIAEERGREERRHGRPRVAARERRLAPGPEVADECAACLRGERKQSRPRELSGRGVGALREEAAVRGERRAGVSRSFRHAAVPERELRAPRLGETAGAREREDGLQRAFRAGSIPRLAPPKDERQEPFDASRLPARTGSRRIVSAASNRPARSGSAPAGAWRASTAPHGPVPRERAHAQRCRRRPASRSRRRG